jgi:Family of unknown function (DUF6659)
MKAEEFSKNILSLDPKIRFAGLLEKSGHLFAGGSREGIDNYLQGKNSEFSLSQSAFIIDLRNFFSSEVGNLEYIVYAHNKVKMFNIPLKDYILVFSTENTINIEDIVKRISDYIKSVESQLMLHPPSNIITDEKKETLKNLYDSGIEEDMISDQLDLDLPTVRTLIKEVQAS